MQSFDGVILGADMVALSGRELWSNLLMRANTGCSRTVASDDAVDVVGSSLLTTAREPFVAVALDLRSLQ